MTRRPAKKPGWTDEELGIAVDLSVTVEAAAALIGRTPKAVRHKRQQVRDGWTPQRQPWSQGDDELITSLPHYRAAEIARLLGRTTVAVQQRRRIVGGPGCGNVKGAFVVGRRRLLAKTCLGCGLLLNASWFGLESRGWRSKCVRCRPNENDKARSKAFEAKRASSAERRRRLQLLSEPHAVRHGLEYLASDHVVLADPDLSVLEKAIRLGRTYAATARQVVLHGYSSRVGKGDPARGQWRIYRRGVV